jgi:hypothetical protein
MTSSGDGTVPRLNSNKSLGSLYCYTQEIAASFIASRALRKSKGEVVVQGDESSSRSLGHARRRGYLANGLLLLGSVIFALLVGEGIIRAVQPQELGNWTYTRDGLTLHLPNMSQFSSRFGHEIVTNSAGMRDHEHDLNKPPGVYRILVLGDSFMEANQVKFEDAFVSVLGQRLKEGASRPVEVINASVSGWGTDDELAYLTRYGIRFHPDLVLVGMTLHNDVQDNLMEEFHSYANGDLRERPAEEMPLADFALLQVKEFLASRSHLYQMLLRAKRSSWIRNEEKRLNTHVAGLLAKEQTASIKRGWNMTRLLFRKMKQRSAEIGAPLVVFLIPLRMQISDRNLQGFLDGHDMTRDQIILDQPQRTMMQIGTVEGIMVMDLLTGFRRQEKMAPDRLYLEEEGHWTAAGHRLAADLVADQLITSGVLPVGSADFRPSR